MEQQMLPYKRASPHNSGSNRTAELKAQTPASSWSYEPQNVGPLRKTSPETIQNARRTEYGNRSKLEAPSYSWRVAVDLSVTRKCTKFGLVPECRSLA